MKATHAVSLAIVFLLVGAHRLPAPISEVPETTPIPKPKREATPRPKPKTEATAKPKATPNRSFAGTWTGTAITKIGTGGENGGSTNYIIRISDDEKTVWINWDSQQPSGPGHQVPSNRSRETLSWSLTVPEYVVADTLRINANGTASFVREGQYPATTNFWGGEDPGITFNQTGTLSRQDGSSAPSVSQTAPVSAPQATTTAAPQTGGIPTARPVPNKPGFVFSPFDPKTKAILDVRGRASGTKVKDMAGRIFIVP